MNQTILTRDDGEALSMFEGKHVVPLHSESGNYREWDIGVNLVKYCIIQEGDEWTLMYYDRQTDLWEDAPDDVDNFLLTNKLILAV